MTLNGDVEEGQPQLPSPIQRILIIHLNLHERCTNGESLGENASLEELSESILYYHRDQRIDVMADRNDKYPDSKYLMQEAVQFLGLCTAFYTLPSSLTLSKSNKTHSNGKHNKTQAIYFEKSTLVFIPLESSMDIVAVVQVARSSMCACTSNAGSGDPLAMQSSFERSHRLFCLFNGGGILCRLNGGTSKSPKKSLPYHGMDHLFGLLKELRKANQRLLRYDTEEDKHAQIGARIKDLVDEIRSMRQGLTIQSLRTDLDAHYKEYISDFSLVASRNGGAGRCLVEVPPAPIAQNSGSHTSQVLPSLANPHSFALLAGAIHETLCAYPPGNVDSLGLSAVSLFHDGQLLHCEASPKSRLLLSSELANLLMAYMASYQSKMNQLVGIRDSSLENAESTASPSYQRGLRSLTRTIGSMAGSLTKDEVAPRHTSVTHAQHTFDPQHRGRFLATPPSYMLSVSHQTHSIELGDNIQSIWAPLVHLPSELQESEETSDCSCSGVHLVMFRFLQFSFLLFLKLPPRSNTLLDTTRLLLMKLEEELSEAVLLAINDKTVNESERGKIKGIFDLTNTTGQDIILLERDKYRMVLLQDLTRSSSRYDTKFRISKGKQHVHRLLRYGTKKNKETTATKSTVTGSLSVEWSALGLDCRHLLASRLPLDACLAFDDMINEMTAMGRRGKGKERTLEICTCMSFGWVYAFGKGDKEIYVFFDSSIYVTVADVQSAAKRVRETFAAV
jgi:hypothetical protein